VRGSGGAPRAASTRSGRDGVSGFLPLLPLRVAFSVGRVSFYVGRVGAAARVTGPRLPLRETQLGRCLLFFFLLLLFTWRCSPPVSSVINHRAKAMVDLGLNGSTACLTAYT
jgi:hypothetical protein